MNRVCCTICILLLYTVLSPAIPVTDRIKADGTLVVPGLGAERVLLGEDIEQVFKRRGYPDKTAVFKQGRDLFSQILQVKVANPVFGDRLYSYTRSGSVVVAYQKRVCAIIGLGANRITIDAVDLAAGIERVLFSYGNQGLAEYSSGKNRLYCYPRLGITFIDDRGDNSVDGYIVHTIVDDTKKGS